METETKQLVANASLETIESVVDELRASLNALTAHRLRLMHQLLPDEDRACQSMMGKIVIMADFLELPPPLLVDMRAPSLAQAIEMSRAMVRDVRAVLALERLH